MASSSFSNNHKAMHWRPFCSTIMGTPCIYYWYDTPSLPPPPPPLPPSPFPLTAGTSFPFRNVCMIKPNANAVDYILNLL